MASGSIPTGAVEVVVPPSIDESWCSEKAEYWLDGKKVGERRWWRNGNLSDELPMSNGVPHGTARWWRQDGKTLASEHSYKDGLLEGVSRGWHPNGVLASETWYRRGKKHGWEREWNSKGELVWELPYRDGKLHGVARYWKGVAELQAPLRKMPKSVSFWMDGREVTRAEYLAAARTNDSLPPIPSGKAGSAGAAAGKR